MKAPPLPGRAATANSRPKPKRTSLPIVVLPGGTQTTNESARQLGKLLAKDESYSLRGGTVVRVASDSKCALHLEVVKPIHLVSGFEDFASLHKRDKDGRLRPSKCPESDAKAILNSRAFRDELPELKTISACPVLIERDERLETITGYDKSSGIFANGVEPEEVELPEACDLLLESLQDYSFASPSDKSRALSAMLTPALVMGGFLNERAPVDLGTADSPQTGKGYRNKQTAAIYNQEVCVVTQKQNRTRMEAAFDKALFEGRGFISLDNLRGRVDLPSLESFCTEDTYSARPAYTPETVIDPRRFFLQMTSNEANLTPDLVKRCSVVRLLNQGSDYEFSRYDVAGGSGDILQFIRENQPKYLGAVFAVIREWHGQGKPRTKESRHARREWAQILDWIVQNIFGEAPLMDGHDDASNFLSNNLLVWLQSLAHMVDDIGQVGQELSASDLVNVLNDKDLSDTEERKLRQLVGRKMKQVFAQRSVIEAHGMEIERQERVFDSKTQFVYEFRRKT